MMSQSPIWLLRKGSASLVGNKHFEEVYMLAPTMFLTLTLNLTLIGGLCEH